MRGALSQVIMATLTEQQIEQRQGPYATRQQAAELLEELQAQYQQLSRCERGAIKAYLSNESYEQFSMEGEE